MLVFGILFLSCVSVHGYPPNQDYDSYGGSWQGKHQPQGQYKDASKNVYNEMLREVYDDNHNEYDSYNQQQEIEEHYDDYQPNTKYLAEVAYSSKGQHYTAPKASTYGRKGKQYHPHSNYPNNSPPQDRPVNPYTETYRSHNYLPTETHAPAVVHHAVPAYQAPAPAVVHHAVPTYHAPEPAPYHAPEPAPYHAPAPAPYHAPAPAPYPAPEPAPYHAPAPAPYYASEPAPFHTPAPAPYQASYVNKEQPKNPYIDNNSVDYIPERYEESKENKGNNYTPERKEPFNPYVENHGNNYSPESNNNLDNFYNKNAGRYQDTHIVNNYTPERKEPFNPYVENNGNDYILESNDRLDNFYNQNAGRPNEQPRGNDYIAEYNPNKPYDLNAIIPEAMAGKPYSPESNNNQYNLNNRNTGRPQDPLRGNNYTPERKEPYNPYVENNGNNYIPERNDNLNSFYNQNAGKPNDSPRGNEYIAEYNSNKPYDLNAIIPEAEAGKPYYPHQANTGNKYNPSVGRVDQVQYMPTQFISRESNEVYDDKSSYNPLTDPYYESYATYDPSKRQSRQSGYRQPNPAYLRPNQPYDSTVTDYYPTMSSRYTKPSNYSSSLYTEDLSDYQSFVSGCYEKKFATIKMPSANDVRSMRQYNPGDRYQTPEYPLLSKDNREVDYEVLRASPHGRHLLMVTLLESHDKDYWEERCEGLVKIYLPDSLKSPKQPPTPRNACNLKEIRVNGRVWTRQDVMSVYHGIAASKLVAGEQFSRYNEVHNDALKSFVKFALYMPDFDCMMSLLVVLRDSCNKRLFIEGLASIIQAREDVGFIIPSLASVIPEQFVPATLSQDHERENRQGGQGGGQVIRFGSTHSTYPNTEPESRMWHMREDPTMGSMHWTWHLMLSDANTRRNMRRRGEMFYHMHRQMLSRYNCDRIAVGLGPVTPYSPQDWQRPGGLISYTPNVLRGYNGRPAGATMNAADRRRLGETRDTLYRAVDTGTLEGVRLGYVGGEDVGISALGDAAEPFGNRFSTNYHNRGHIAISGMSNGGNGVMGGTENAPRDPAFFRWHMSIDLIFARYKRNLGDYPDADLGYPGVTVTGLSTVSQGQQNRLRTFLTLDTLQLDDQELTVTNRGGSTHRIERLAHDPFVYNIQLQSTVTGQGVGRIFLVPTAVANGDVYNFAIEMDKFLVNLTPGTQTIQRTTSQSPIFTRGPPTLNNLQNNLMRGMSERDFNWARCGYPLSMALPRGSATGVSFQLVFIVSQLLPQDRQRINEWADTGSAWGWCGYRDGQRGLPDGRPLAFPFDRSMTVGDVINGRSNAVSTTINIVHG